MDDKKIDLHVTEEQYLMIAEAAAASEMTISEYITTCLFYRL